MLRLWQIQISFIQVIRDFVCKLPHTFPNNLNVRLKEIKKYNENPKIRWGPNVAPSVPAKVKFSEIAIKNKKKKVIKILLSCLILLEFFTCCQIFCPRLSVEKTFAHSSSQSRSNLNILHSFQSFLKCLMEKQSKHDAKKFQI